MIAETEHEQAELELLRKINRKLEPRTPIFNSVPVSDALSVMVDYQNRRFIYIRSAVDLTLSAGSYGTWHLPAALWYQLEFRPGTQFVTSGQGNTSVILETVAIDEKIDYQFPYASNTPTPHSSVTAANADTPLLAANSARKAAYFFNDSTATLFLSLGNGQASATSYLTQIGPGGFYELPATPLYTGQIRGFWSVANGAVRITELS